MRSTFHGLETARRALYTQQTALHTTGHNIANANTPGYSRQRVNFSQTEPYPKPGLNQPTIPGQIGTGVKAGAIQRVRESFLDMQYRAENSKFGYWDTRHVALQKLEDIMNEPSEDGIAKTLDQFWTALQDLSVHPEDSGARSVVRQRGLAVAETFNYTADSLKAIQRDYKGQIDVTVKEINSLTSQINQINKQIAAVEPHGYMPNDLYDQRDQLIDRLSELVNVKVEPVRSGGQALEIAEGKYTIKLIDENGRDLGVTLVDGTRLDTNQINVVYDEETGLAKDIFIASEAALKKGDFDYITAGGASVFSVEDFRAIGEFKAGLEAYGYLTKSGEERGIFPDMLRQLDQMVFTFVEEFNAVHRAGWNLNEINSGVKNGLDFFTYSGHMPTSNNIKGASSRLQLSEEIRSGLDSIAAAARGVGTQYGQMGGDGPEVRGIYTGSDATLSVRVEGGSFEYSLNGTDWTSFPAQNKVTVNGLTIDASKMNVTEDQTWTLAVSQGARLEGFAGDGSNALALASVKDAILNFGNSTTNIQSFYQGVIGDMAVNTNEADRMMRNSDTLRMSVDQRRESVSGVSLDEEMTNLIQYQHAYNAAARMITLVDEMLDRIINGMGTAGR